MKRTFVIGMMLIAVPLGAQAPRSPADTEQRLQRRYQITLMENVLSSAVRHAAEMMARRIQTLAPGSVLLTGTGRARGFVLPSYGVFFDVEVPALPVSVAWTMRVMERDLDAGRSLQTLRDFVSGHAASLSDAERRELELALRRMELSVGPVAASTMPAPAPTPQGRGAVQAATVVPSPAPPPSAGSTPAGAAPGVRDPDQEYTDVVKDALVDAMLDFSGPMNVGSDEWLTVAARDSYGPIAPNEMYDAMTITLQIKGSDLAAFRADRLTRDEARKRVEVRGF